MPPEMLAGLKPEFVVPLVAVLTHPDGPDASGKVFEVGAGFVAEIRWERSKGALFKTDETFTPSAVQEKWAEVTNFAGATHPNEMGDMDPTVRRLKPAIHCVLMTCLGLVHRVKEIATK